MIRRWLDLPLQLVKTSQQQQTRGTWHGGTNKTRLYAVSKQCGFARLAWYLHGIRQLSRVCQRTRSMIQSQTHPAAWRQGLYSEIVLSASSAHYPTRPCHKTYSKPPLRSSLWLTLLGCVHIRDSPAPPRKGSERAWNNPFLVEGLPTVDVGVGRMSVCHSLSECSTGQLSSRRIARIRGRRPGIFWQGSCASLPGAAQAHCTSLKWPKQAVHNNSDLRPSGVPLSIQR